MSSENSNGNGRKSSPGSNSRELLNAMEHFITTKSVVGEPMTFGDTTIIPLADVSFGMGLGMFSSDGNGTGGVGGKITPSAVLVIKDGTSKLVNVKDQSGIDRLVDMAPDMVNKISSFISKDKNVKETSDQSNSEEEEKSKEE